MLAAGFSEGRLDRDEYDQRLDQVTSAKSLGELVPVLRDLTVDRPSTPSAPAYASAPPQPNWSRRGGMIGPFPRWWLALAILFNVIWLMTSVGVGRPLYYWPMWPMLGTGVPIILGLLSGGGRRAAPEQNRQLPPAPDQDLR